MNVDIRPFRIDEIEAVVALSLSAWAPVFESFEQILGSTIYRRIYPDWQASQRATVEMICGDIDKNTTLVADIDGRIAGFIVYALNSADKTGEVELLAVHPDYQNDGIGTELNNVALDAMQQGGMRLAVVGTGGDPGHAPARRSYEKAGYTALPLVRYYKAL